MTGATARAAARVRKGAAWMIAFSPSQGRAAWPVRPWNVTSALMLPTQPACTVQEVGSPTNAKDGIPTSRESRSSGRSPFRCASPSSRS